MTERLYYTDSYLAEFRARVVGTDANGLRVCLDRTAFYPSSGGQPNDIGTIAGVPVVDVIDEGERIVHVTSGIRDQPELMAYAASKAALDKFVRDTVPQLRGTGVLMNLLDPGWLRTDLGGPSAPNAVESVLPGALAPVLVDGEVHGAFFAAQDFAGKTLA